MKEYCSPEGNWGFWSDSLLDLWKLCSLASLDTLKPPESPRACSPKYFYKQNILYRKARVSFAIRTCSALFKWKCRVTGSSPSFQLRAFVLQLSIDVNMCRKFPSSQEHSPSECLVNSCFPHFFSMQKAIRQLLFLILQLSIRKWAFLFMLGENSTGAIKLPFSLKQFQAGRGKTISNVEVIGTLKHFFGERFVEHLQSCMPSCRSHTREIRDQET